MVQVVKTVERTHNELWAVIGFWNEKNIKSAEIRCQKYVWSGMDMKMCMMTNRMGGPTLTLIWCISYKKYHCENRFCFSLFHEFLPQLFKNCSVWKFDISFKLLKINSWPSKLLIAEWKKQMTISVLTFSHSHTIKRWR